MPDPRPSTAPAHFVPAAALLLSLALLPGCQALISRLYLPREGVRKPEHGVQVRRDVVTTTRDGVDLISFVYKPKTAGTTPVILIRVPAAKSFTNRLRADAIGRFFASRGYTAVFQGTRGRFHSEGEFYPLRPQRDDGIDTLKWLRDRDWFDGRLGMWGGSSFGYTQWAVADQTDPGPQAMAIQISSSSFHDMFHPGGAFSLESALLWSWRSHRGADFWTPFEHLEPALEGLPVLEADDRLGADISYFNDWASHTEKAPYWNEIDGTDRPATLAAPVLLMAGWYDPFLPGQIADFMSIGKKASPAVAAASRLVIGPWAHARSVELPDGFEPVSYRKEALGRAVPWFDRHLKGDGRMSETAPVRLFVMGENVWRDEQEWPLARTRYTSWYLRSGGAAGTSESDGRLSLDAPASPESPDRYIYDPDDPVPSAGGTMLGPRAGIERQNEVEARDDVLVYTTAPLERDLEVTGPVEVILHVSTSAPSTDFTGKLVDVHPDGRAWNVSDGILRRDYGDGGGEKSGQAITEIVVRMWPTSMLFRAGHRIRLEISSSNFPRFDRNPNTGGFIPAETEPVTARQAIHHSPGALSRLVLPVIPGSLPPDLSSRNVEGHRLLVGRGAGARGARDSSVGFYGSTKLISSNSSSRTIPTPGQ